MRDPLEVVTSLSDWLKQTIEKDTLLPIGLCNTHHDKKNSRMTNLPVHMWQALECVPIILSPYCCKYSHWFRSTSSHRPTSPATRSSSKNSRTRTGAVRLLATNKKSFFGSPLFFLQTTHTHPQLSCSNPKLRNYWRSVIFCYPGWLYFKCNTFLGVVGKNLMKKYSHTTVLTTLNPLKSNAVTLHIILKGIV